MKKPPVVDDFSPDRSYDPSPWFPHRSGTSSFSVPGNLLLAGEYAVLEEGGLGLSLAVREVSLRFTLREQKTWELFGTAGGGRRRIGGEGPAETVGDRLFRFFLKHYASSSFSGSGTGAGRAFRIEADSSAFFSGAGRKSGLGSSAALAVGLSRIFADGLDPESEEIPARALAAHREAQGGRGSGYDVYCSFYGGLRGRSGSGWGLFRGGASPRYQEIQPLFPRLGLLRAGTPVSSVDAVQAYRNKKEENPRSAAAFLRENNRLVLQMLEDGEARFPDNLRALREHGRRWGKELAVPAEFPCCGEEANNRDLILKCCGAGNEIAVFPIVPRLSVPEGALLLTPAEPGEK